VFHHIKTHKYVNETAVKHFQLAFSWLANNNNNNNNNNKMDIYIQQHFEQLFAITRSVNDLC